MHLLVIFWQPDILLHYLRKKQGKWTVLYSLGVSQYTSQFDEQWQTQHTKESSTRLNWYHHNRREKSFRVYYLFEDCNTASFQPVGT